MDGSTLVLATVGDPVVQVQTPGRMPELFAERNINATWVPLHVKAANLPVIVAMLRQVENFRGCSITVPHKVAMMALVDRPTPRALVSGSLNLVRREADGTLTGDMVDGLGFVRGLAATGRNVAGKEAWLVGTGGAGAAIAAALCESGIGCLWLKDAVSGRAEELADRLQHHFSEMRIGVSDRQPDRIDYVINATPLGLRPDDPLPFDISGLPASAVVCDIIMKPARTALLQAAEALGLATHPGTPMLTAALPLYLEFFGLSSGTGDRTS
jgi:shikimate dehydrogenase